MLLIFIIQSFLKTRYLCCYTEVSFSSYSCKYWKYTQLVVQTFDSSFVECNSFDFFYASVPILIIITLNTSKWQTRLLLSAKLSPDTSTARQGLLRTNQSWGLWSRDPTPANHSSPAHVAQPVVGEHSHARRRRHVHAAVRPHPALGTQTHAWTRECDGMARLYIKVFYNFDADIKWCCSMLGEGPYLGLLFVTSHLHCICTLVHLESVTKYAKKALLMGGMISKDSESVSVSN